MLENVELIVKEAREISAALRAVETIGPILKNHPFSGRFLEYKSLVNDLGVLEKLKDSVCKQVLIQDITCYMNDEENHVPLTERVTTLQSEICRLKDELNTYIHREESLRKELKTLKTDYDQCDAVRKNDLVLLRKRLSDNAEVFMGLAWYRTVDPKTVGRIFDSISKSIRL
jgi:predicted nuclease with TOPRIM domain